MSPVAPLIETAPGAEYVPPAVPVRVTVAVPAFEQYGVPVYAIVAAGNAVTVMDVDVENAGHPPAAAMVYVTV